MRPRASTDKHGSQNRGHPPLDAKERKKVILLGVLGAICIVVVGMQFWKHKGPATASAATSPSAADGASGDLASTLDSMRRSRLETSVDDDRGLFANIEEAISVFIDGPKTPTIAPRQLPENVFGVPELKQADSGSTSPAADSPPTDETEAASPDVLDALTLETVLVSSRNRAAIINGQVYHTGETVEGFRIAGIAPGQVTLTRDGRTHTLVLE